MYSTTFPTGSESTENGTIYTELISHLSLGKPHWEVSFLEKVTLKLNAKPFGFKNQSNVFQSSGAEVFALACSEVIKPKFEAKFPHWQCQTQKGWTLLKTLTTMKVQSYFWSMYCSGSSFRVVFKDLNLVILFNVPSSENTVPVHPTQQPFLLSLDTLSHNPVLSFLGI